MTTKEYLQQYQKQDNLINRKSEELERLRALATKTTPTYSDMPKSCGGADKVQCAVERIILLQDELNSEIDKLITIKQNIIMSAKSTNNKLLCDLLCYRYINGFDWSKITNLLCKTNVDYVRMDLHQRALKDIQVYFV